MTASLEKADPEKFADFLVQFAQDPECNLAALGRRCGLSKQHARLIAKRLETTYLPVLKEVEKVTSKSLIKGLEDALPLALKQLGNTELIEKAGITARAAAATKKLRLEIISFSPLWRSTPLRRR